MEYILLIKEKIYILLDGGPMCICVNDFVSSTLHFSLDEIFLVARKFIILLEKAFCDILLYADEGGMD
jgi:hypothetical protein